MSKAPCVVCRHAIDDAARVCPFCGSDPRTGEKIIDAQAILQSEFQPRHVTTATEGVLQFARQRQGVVIALGVIALILLLAGFHQFVMARNASAVSDAAAVPLTDVADLSNQSADGQALPMPDMKFQYDGNPKTMRAYIVEPGAVPPATASATQPPATTSGGAPPSAATAAAQPPSPAPQPKP